MSTAAEIAWAAGIFEGEGCWSTVGKAGKYGRHNFRATLMMADEDVVLRFAAVVGVGKVYDRKQGRPNCALTVWHCGKRAELDQLIAMFRPWLGQRRLARLDELIANANLPAASHAEGWRTRRRNLSRSGSGQFIKSASPDAPASQRVEQGRGAYCEYQ